MSSIPEDKNELLQSITVSFDKILQDYLSIPNELTRINEIEGNIKGTQISVSDTLAYLIGWGKLVLKWHRLKVEGLEVDFPETGYKWNELGQLAESFHTQYQDLSYEELISLFKTTISKLLLLIESLDNQSLYSQDWYKKYTLGRMIQFNTSSPMKNMRIKVRRFKKLKQIK